MNKTLTFLGTVLAAGILGWLSGLLLRWIVRLRYPDFQKEPQKEPLQKGPVHNDIP